ncbi:hypothetical protein [Serratia silvae]|uniref:Uncharacterized protein n=1 Tax=Serratia silvae TaxID=2824122 RepID=A0ABT0KHQ7_9GAMM|nr:hypothetical protein [Serratia silvae]MCL1031471.1 hypothetical protein [Serratia silvae]
MNGDDKSESQKQAEFREGRNEKISSSKTPFKDFLAGVGFLFVLAALLYMLFGNVEIGKLSFGYNDFFGYFIRYNI